MTYGVWDDNGCEENVSAESAEAAANKYVADGDWEDGSLYMYGWGTR